MRKVRKEFEEALKELKEEMLNNSKWTQDWCIEIKNFVGGNSYNGFNILLLSKIMVERKHKTPYFMTFKQAKEKGYKIKKGAKSYPIYFYKPLVIEEKVEVIENGEVKEEVIKRTIPYLKKYYVFNIEDINGDFKIEDKKEVKVEVKELLEKINRYIEIAYGRPAYYPKKHIITMPIMENFESKEAYLAALFHELTHSTAKYTKRELNIAEEEVVAELGSVILCKHFNIDYPITRHAAYIKSWGKDIEDKRFYSVLKHTFKAVEFLLDTLDS